jgi:flagellar biosynthetic protein FliP
MVALGPVWSAVWPSYGDRFEVMVLVMATDMAVAMAAWMLVRGHSRRVTAEMSAVMYLPFLLLFPPYWAGWVSGGVVMTAGHLLMLPAMAAVLWWRRDEHAH